MSRHSARAAAATIITSLFYFLHQDSWFWNDARPLVLGFLPVGLFYHVAYTAATSVLLWGLVHFFWPSHLELDRSSRE
jgi:hypothetical protein